MITIASPAKHRPGSLCQELHTHPLPHAQDAPAGGKPRLQGARTLPRGVHRENWNQRPGRGRPHPELQPGWTSSPSPSVGRASPTRSASVTNTVALTGSVSLPRRPQLGQTEGSLVHFHARHLACNVSTQAPPGMSQIIINDFELDRTSKARYFLPRED